jgi:lysophospholipase L1-like esterase
MCAHRSHRHWKLRILAITMGLLPFVMLECILRFIGFGNREIPQYDPFLDFSQISSLFVRDGDSFCLRPERQRLFVSTQFPAIKGKNTRRIFCIGGSTTQGEPYQHQTAFPTWLQINLQLADPATDWEVVNCGGLSYASYRMLPIVHEVLTYEPDLIVLECGHNEFLEERELERWRHVPNYVWRGVSWLNSFHTVRFVSHLVRTESPTTAKPSTVLEKEVDALLDHKGGLEHYQRGGLDRESVMKSMIWNLQAMLDACQKKGVPTVLVVPGADRWRTPPFKYEFDPSAPPERREQAEELWKRLSNSEPKDDEIATLLEELLTLDPDHAAANYWLGQIRGQRGEYAESEKLLQKALDIDVCPLRATTSIQNAIRGLARQMQSWLLDVDSMFMKPEKAGWEAADWFVDHVHPTILGHQRIGEQLADILDSHLWFDSKESDWRESRESTYRVHMAKLGGEYYIRGKQRLEGLMLWAHGRARTKINRPQSNPSQTSEP